MRKHQIDDFSYWRLQQENTSKSFPYVFPQMPRQFRCWYVFTKVLFLLQWGFFGFFALDSMILLVPILIFKELSVLMEKAPSLALLAVPLIPSLMISFLAALLRFTPKLFWHCPCCGRRFPYYAPARGENLREKACLLAVKSQQIRSVKPKFCPLIIPSICPECKTKFFEIADNEKQDKEGKLGNHSLTIYDARNRTW